MQQSLEFTTVHCSRERSRKVMIIDGEKFACETCIRGHRTTQCQHFGKILRLSNVATSSAVDKFTTN